MISTLFRIPVIEETLLGFYSRTHKELASCIFHDSIKESRQRLLPLFVDGFDPIVYCNKGSGLPPSWTGRHDLRWSIDYSYYMTVYLRVNCAAAMGGAYMSTKLKQFINAHIPVVSYLELLDDPTDAALELPLPYTPLGKSRHDEDRNHIEIESELCVSARPLPLEVLEREFPTVPWTFEQVLERGLEKGVRNACLYVMEQCKLRHGETKSAEVQDALWFYHACFLDYLYNYKPEYDRYMPVELYPFDNRAFTAYDLPSAFHVLAQIPLWGEQSAPLFVLGKFIQKSLPFAGARRKLIDHTDKLIVTNESFWKVFSGIFYCLLLDMYPSSFSVERCWDINRLLRMKQIASDRDLLRSSLSKNNAKENDKGCFVVFTAFRLWICLMADNQLHYRGHGIDWDAFQEQTVQVAHAIRQTNMQDTTDVFAGARALSSQFKMKVYRYRKTALIAGISERLTECLEKVLYKEGIDMDLDSPIKTRLLNTLIRTSCKEWLTPACLMLMHLPDYGGVSLQSISLVLDIVQVYYNSAKPKDFEALIDQFTVSDFKAIAWYFHVIHILDRVDFRALTFQQVAQIDQAMIKRYTLFPGQALPQHAYNVFFTICCGKIKTLQGCNEYGHRDIAYDMENRVYVCAKTPKKFGDDDEDDVSEYESDRKNARKQRKQFNYITCANNPALCIPLRGFMLVFNNAERYMHCPQCAAFHRVQWSGYKGDTYACSECRSLEEIARTCTVCGMPATKTFGPIIDPLAPDKFQHLYFCGKHYEYATKAPTKAQLFH